MKCSHCGKEISQESRFCKFCGASVAQQGEEARESVQVCPFCHAEVRKGTLFCPRCGTVLPGDAHRKKAESTRKEGNESNPCRRSAGYYTKKRKRKYHLILLLMILLGGFFIIFSRCSADKETESERGHVLWAGEPLSPATKAPPDTFAPIDSRGYTFFIGQPNHFRCKYPSWFEVTGKSDVSMSCHSADCTAIMDIRSYPAKGNTPQDELNQFISDYEGEVSYKFVTDSCYAVRVQDDIECIYQFGQLYQGTYYSFRFYFPIDEFEKYDAMINEIHFDFMEQFRS